MADDVTDPGEAFDLGRARGVQDTLERLTPPPSDGEETGVVFAVMQTIAAEFGVCGNATARDVLAAVAAALSTEEGTNDGD